MYRKHLNVSLLVEKNDDKVNEPDKLRETMDNIHLLR
jgi:hypothetical protein